MGGGGGGTASILIATGQVFLTSQSVSPVYKDYEIENAKIVL